jgi:hypothetical protein
MGTADQHCCQRGHGRTHPAAALLAWHIACRRRIDGERADCGSAARAETLGPCRRAHPGAPRAHVRPSRWRAVRPHQAPAVAAGVQDFGAAALPA